jgi:hypothetical protein
MKRAYLTIAVAAMLGHLLAASAGGWAMETLGNEPLSERNYTQWRGIMPLVNDKTRVHATWANGNEHLFYRGNTTNLNAALAAFAKVEAKHHFVVLRPGPAATRSFDGTAIPYNWSLHVLGGLAGAHANDDGEDLEWQHDPVLTIHVGGDINLDKIVDPDGVTFRAAAAAGARDARESAGDDAAAARKIAEFLQARSPTTGPATRPVR